jgi:hypothetical protein
VMLHNHSQMGFIKATKRNRASRVSGKCLFF